MGGGETSVSTHRRRRLRACVELLHACGGDEAYARAVEHSVHRASPLDSYGHAISALVHALLVRPELKETFEGDALITLAPSHLETERARAVVEGFRAEEEARKAGYAKIKVASGMHRCKKCGSRDVAVWQRQTRSADEPATLFFQCQVTTCMARWRRG